MLPKIMPTFGSLFAGIGGIDLGLERAGWTCSWQVEIDEYCNQVLEKHWPAVRRWDDVQTFPPSHHKWGCGVRECNICQENWQVDLIAGGFPCQPVSLAGRQQGTSDPRWLWPEFARVIAVLRPRLVLVENVPGLLGNGMGDILVDLAACGYDAEWDCIPAATVGAPHRRDRLWIVAYAESIGEQDGAVRVGAGGADVADANAQRCEASEPSRSERVPIFEAPEYGAAFASSGDRASRDWWSVEPAVGRVAHGVPHRVDRVKALGNAVVPQVVEWIGKRLLDVYVTKA